MSRDLEICAVCGGSLAWAHDHREDFSGLDDGPPEPERKKAAPKPPEEMKRIRAQAWETRRQKHGERGHRGSYAR